MMLIVGVIEFLWIITLLNFIQNQVLNSLENKKRGVLDFVSKGEKLMKDPNCPKFLESHVQKLKEAWEDTNEKAQKRKKELTGKNYEL